MRPFADNSHRFVSGQTAGNRFRAFGMNWRVLAIASAPVYRADHRHSRRKLTRVTPAWQWERAQRSRGSRL